MGTSVPAMPLRARSRQFALAPWAAALLVLFSLHQGAPSRAGAPAERDVQARLARLEDPATGRLDRKLHTQLLAQGRSLLPALREHLRRKDCSAYAALLLVQVAPKEGLTILLDGLRQGRWRVPARNTWGILHIVRRRPRGDSAALDATDGFLYRGRTSASSVPLHLDGHPARRQRAGLAAILFRAVVGGDAAFGHCPACGRDIRLRWLALAPYATARLAFDRDGKLDPNVPLYTVNARCSCPAWHSSSTEIAIFGGGRLRATRPPEQHEGRLEKGEYVLLARWLASRSRLKADRPAAPRAVAAAIGLLGHDDLVLRANAARMLGHWKTRDAVMPLIRALKDHEATVRGFAVDALAAIGDRRATAPLAEALRSDDAPFQTRVVRALETLRDPRAVDALLPLLAARYPVSEAAVKAVRVMGDAAVPGLLRMLSHEEWAVRWHACRALVHIADRRAVPHFVALLGDPNVNVRRAAAEGLQRLPDARALAPLMAALCEERHGVFHDYIRALVAIGRPAAPPAAELFLHDQRPGIRERAWRLLFTLGPVGVDGLLLGLDSPLVEVRKKAALGLGYAAGRLPRDAGPREVAAFDRVLPGIQKALRDKDPTVRTAAWKALTALPKRLRTAWRNELSALASEVAKQLGSPMGGRDAARLLRDLGPGGVGALIEALRTGNNNARRLAASVLADTGDPRAIGPLVDAFDCDSAWTQREIGGALCKIIDREQGDLATPLAERLKGRRSPQARAAVAEWLGYAVSKGALGGLPPLLEALSDEEPEVRAAAAQAIRRIGWRAGGASFVEPAVKPLIALLGDRAVSVRASAALALGHVAPGALEPLMRAAKDPMSEVRRAVAEALERVSDPRSVDALLALLTDEAASVRAQAVRSLAAKRDGRIDDRLPGLLRDKSAEVRRRAVGLVQGRDWVVHRRRWQKWVEERGVLDALIRALDDPDADVRARTTRVLGTIRHRRALGPLVERLGDRSGHVRDGAATAIKSIARPHALAVFVDALRRNNEAVRKTALQEVRSLAGQEARLDCGEDPAKWLKWFGQRQRDQQEPRRE